MRAHGIMFHHFHSPAHPAGQGSISQDQFREMIFHLNPARILPADEWQRRAQAGKLHDHDLCLTFDDNLRCQFDVAYPVLRELNLTAFWFVYTSVLEGKLEKLELYRQFRMTRFESVDDFYEAFFAAVAHSPLAEESNRRLASFNPSTYLAGFPFYTDSDRKFRFLRDEVLGPARYHAMMDQMIEDRGLTYGDLAQNLWMDWHCLRQLAGEGHVIGLHSHTHPTRMAHLSPSEQQEEYDKNFSLLKGHLGRAPEAMSHPCNSYNAHTLDILGKMGIKLGFRANMSMLPAPSRLEEPREDHANVLAEMRR
jgi:peptidoglycan/xylan/chitin deacetylase (PgdA/CDA1 family)